MKVFIAQCQWRGLSPGSGVSMLGNGGLARAGLGQFCSRESQAGRERRGEIAGTSRRVRASRFVCVSAAIAAGAGGRQGGCP